MTGFLLTPDVYEDIWVIWEYLTREVGLDIADRIEAELFEGFGVVGKTPGVGHRRADLTGEDVFFYTVDPYMIVFHKAAPVQIVGVLHGKRDIKRILKA